MKLPVDEVCEIVQLKDEDGDEEDYVVLEDFEFENRRFVIMALLDDFDDAEEDDEEEDDEEDKEECDCVIYEFKNEEYEAVEDEELLRRISEFMATPEGQNV